MDTRLTTEFCDSMAAKDSLGVGREGRDEENRLACTVRDLAIYVVPCLPTADSLVRWLSK